MSLDLDAYRRGAEEFLSELDREHYLQMAGHKAELDLEPTYAKHAALFERDTVAALREPAESAAPGDEARRLRYLLAFALDGLMGRETRKEAEEVARLEATLDVETPWGRIPFRQAPIEQANESNPERRAAIEVARDELLSERMNPLHLAALQRAHALCRDLGWASYADAYAGVRGIAFDTLAGQTHAFLDRTEEFYAPILDPQLRAAGVPPLQELTRADLPRFFRAPTLDALYPAEMLVDSLHATLAGMGIGLRSQENVHLDTESRETKSPRAFCSPVRVPDEVYLVIAPVGGRDDFAALFHEAGHTEHYANVDPSLPFEFRHLGDNSVTESFAFLLEHLTEDPAWLEDRLGVSDALAALSHARADRLYYLRRYAAKLAYELELHGPHAELGRMPDRYAELLGGATRVRWSSAAWLADVDPGFYVACYLRAWALETHWRGALVERWGKRWFAEPEAGAWLIELWRKGQRLDADELLGEELGTELDFGAVAAEVDAWAMQPG